MSRKLMFCAILMMTTSAFALTPDEQKILNDALTSPTYFIDYKNLCSTPEGKTQADNVSPALDTILGTMMSDLYSAKADFSQKRNTFETATYNSLASAHTHVQQAQDNNSNNWSSDCFSSKK